MIKYLKKFFYHTSLFLSKQLQDSNQIRSYGVVKHTNDALIELK